MIKGLPPLLAGGGETLPVGSIVPYLNNDDLPEGYLLCDGAEVLKSEYGNLYNVIGDTYGEPSDGIHFVLPDLRDKFIEGSITAGDDIEAGLPNIKGEIAAAFVPILSSTDTDIHTESGAIYTSRKDGALKGSGAGAGVSGFNFDASRSNSIYSDDVDTVQPPSLTVRYIIKALGSGQTLIPADNTKLSVSYRDTFTYIYPNGGTEDSPANVDLSTRYVETNPFPGYIVDTQVEVYYNGEWGSPNFCQWRESNGTYYSTGVRSKQFDNDSIVVQTARVYIIYDQNWSGDSFLILNNDRPTTLPCRVKIWKVGKINSDIPDIQEVVNVIEKANNKVTVTYRDTFTYIYPNGGTVESPGNISVNSRYIETNPFPGYIVNIIPELYVNGEWGHTNWVTLNNVDSSRWYTDGVSAAQHNNDYIEITTGNNYLIEASAYKNSVNGHSWAANNFPSTPSATLPCRLKVYKVGKLDPDVPDLQEMTVTNVLEKPRTVTTVTYEDTFTIIYPNNGTEESPANIVNNTRYVEDNPFPGYIVNCAAEIQINGKWGQTGWWSASSTAHGTVASQFDNDQIIIKTGYAALVNMYSGESGAAFPIGTYATSAPCRVKVWKVGKVDNSTPDLQEVSVHNTITVDEDQYLANSFAIIYPNSGTAESPANVTTNTEYIMDNPFPGYFVNCKAELFINNEWGFTNWAQGYGSGANWYSYGVSVAQHNNGNIHLITAVENLINSNQYKYSIDGYTWTNINSPLATAPCRIKVWKIGKIPTT